MARMSVRFGAQVLLALGLAVHAAVPDVTFPPTRYERSGGLETPRLAETMEECVALAKASPCVTVTSFGQSPQGRDLPLVIVDRDGAADPAKVKRSGRAVVLIQACIHAGECEGKDAGILFLRDVAVTKKYAALLEHLTFLFIPVFNVDGHERFGAFNRINQNGPREMGWRVNATNLNLNRDYLKADTQEIRAWLKLFQAWLPDFFLDCHTTDGADYQYVMTYDTEMGVTPWFIEPRLGSWVRDTFVKEFETLMSQDGFPVFPYVTFRSWHDPRSGLVGWPARPMLSHGYLTAQNRPSMLLETHMLKPYKLRVEATRAALQHTCEILCRERDRLLRLNREADAYTSSRAFREQPMVLAFTDSGVSHLVAFKGYEYAQEKSTLSGGDWFKYDKTRPAEFRIPYFLEQKPTASAKLPEAYLIPAEWTDVIARLDFHGIHYRRLPAPQKVAVATYRFDMVQWQKGIVEGRQRVDSLDLGEVTEERLFPAGSVVVPTGQRQARVLAHLLEPASEDSLLRWGFFNTIFEQKEFGESYILEGLARDMLAKDPSLRAEFELKKGADKAFAADPAAILNWFYNRSPYRDLRLNVYPVGKVLDEATTKRLLTK
jgi:Zinc carboxypeptidase